MTSIRKRCKLCGTEGEVSARGLCLDCGMSLNRAACRQLHEKSGPIYEKWKARIRGGVEK